MLNKIAFDNVYKRMKEHVQLNRNTLDKLKEEERRESKAILKRTQTNKFYNSRLPKNIWFKTLDMLEPKNVSQVKIIKTLLHWDESPSSTFKPLPYISGPSGIGKTFIAMHFMSHMISKGVIDISFFSLSKFIIKYRDFDKDWNIDLLLKPNILILDDFCSHNSTKLVLEFLHSVLDHRLVEEKPTLITSNICINEVSRFLYSTGSKSNVGKRMCDAIEDRLFSLCSIGVLNGPSLRKAMALDNFYKETRF